MDSFLKLLLSPRGLLIALGVALFIIGMLQINWQDRGPCDADQYTRSCFSIAESACMKAVTQFDHDCKNILSQMQFSAGRLVSPIQRRCRELKYTRAFSALALSDSTCESRRKDLEEWSKSNPDF